ncbi:MAG: DNA polymerase-1 [Verrucomicrobiales bacterium]|jgi:DNA polymerase-1
MNSRIYHRPVNAAPDCSVTDRDVRNLFARLDVSGGALAAIALRPGVGLGVALAGEHTAWTEDDPMATIAALDKEHSPRWVWWDRATADQFALHDLSIDRCWDILTVHRLLHGGWRTSIPRAWAWLHGLSEDSLPKTGQLGLLDEPLDEGGDPEDPVLADGHLRPEWVQEGWHGSPARLAVWANLALRSAELQHERLAGRPNPKQALSTARSESGAELLCAELERNGLPIDEGEANAIIEAAAGPKPAGRADEDAERERRDRNVLDLLNPPQEVNLRNPAEVKAMLRRTGLDLPDTRAWRLESLRESDPLIDALLIWRKRERIATTYGHGWLAEHVESGRLRGEWSSSDGAAGRMTASAGLHNLPAPMRPVVAADDDHLFVRADLGQIEPRVLAAVSGDPALIAATLDDDLYQPVASRLRVEREIAKVAVLGAMYGATTGESAGALQGLKKNFPVAMDLLDRAAEDGRRGNSIFTIGGRKIPMWVDPSVDGDLDRAQSVAASRGRFARNALIQGAAAEFFKVWAIIVRRRVRPLNAHVVLCLHDELLVHAPAAVAGDVAQLVEASVLEAAHFWSPDPKVRFLADISTIKRWSEAKG